MNKTTQAPFLAAAAAFLSLLTLAGSGCHQADPEGESMFPTDVEPGTPNKGSIVLDVYAVDHGAVTNGNDTVCVWSCNLKPSGGKTTDVFKNCSFNDELSAAENAQEGYTPLCDPEAIPPGTHSFALRNLPAGYYLFNLNTVVTVREVTVMDGGATDWRDMCIGRTPDGCTGGASTGGTTGGDSDSGSGTGGGGCNDDSDCDPGQICDQQTCKGAQVTPCYRPAGNSPDPGDNKDLVGKILNVGTNFVTMNWNIYCGQLLNGFCPELPDWVGSVTIDDTNAPRHPVTNKKLCWAVNGSQLECDKAALGSLTDEQSGNVYGYYYMNSPDFTAPLLVESYAWNIPVK